MKILRLPEVMQRTGLSRSVIYSRMADDTFPQSVQLGTRSIGFVEHEVDAWIEQLVEARATNGKGGA